MAWKFDPKYGCMISKTPPTLRNGKWWPSYNALSRAFGMSPTAARSWLFVNPNKTVDDLVTFWTKKGYRCVQKPYPKRRR